MGGAPEPGITAFFDSFDFWEAQQRAVKERARRARLVLPPLSISALLETEVKRAATVFFGDAS
jgi:hypothetical protein